MGTINTNMMCRNYIDNEDDIFDKDQSAVISNINNKNLPLKNEFAQPTKIEIDFQIQMFKKFKEKQIMTQKRIEYDKEQLWGRQQVEKDGIRMTQKKFKLVKAVELFGIKQEDDENVKEESKNEAYGNPESKFTPAMMLLHASKVKRRKKILVKSLDSDTSFETPRQNHIVYSKEIECDDKKGSDMTDLKVTTYNNKLYKDMLEQEIKPRLHKKLLSNLITRGKYLFHEANSDI